MNRHSKITLTLVALVAGLAAVDALPAQERQVPGLWLPNASPRAEVGQTVGIAELKVYYHRPAVNDRDVWGALVPYGQVWRTGANENTVLTVSHDVSVAGKILPAGAYGLHMLPGEEEWQVIFSNDHQAWGSFSYDEANDALRVAVKPEAAPHQERMLFAFEEVDNDSTTLALRWEALRVPVEIEVDSKSHTLASIEKQLTGLAQFTWQGWNQAANYCLQNDLQLEQALDWADRSIQAEERFNNLSTKSQILAKLGREDESTETMARALESANAGQLHNYARQLQGRGENEEALAVFQQNLQKHPDAWFVELGVARGHSGLGNFEEAVKSMKVALDRAPENQKAYVQTLIDRLEKNEKI